MIEGGLEFVVAAYAVTIVALAAYARSLAARSGNESKRSR